MKNYKSNLEEQLKEIDSLIRKTEHSLKTSENLPAQRVETIKSSGHDQFVWVDRTTGKRRYVRAAETDILQKIIQRDYEAKVNKKLKHMRNQLEKLLKKYDISEIEEPYEKMAASKKRLVTPVIEPEEVFMRKWKSVSYTPMPIENETAFYSGSGVRVRSKSELLIADTLEQKGIPYRYEYPLYMLNTGYVRPDFLCLNLRNREEFIWEHFGMMDNTGYVNKAVDKIQKYAQNGHVAGKNMIMTYETSQYPISSIIINKMIEEYLL